LQIPHNIQTSLHEIVLGDHKHGTAQLVDISWGNANLTAIDWGDVKVLGDEQKASSPTTKDGRQKDKTQRLKEFQQALRANRQLAVVLRDQGLYEEADRFAYRAQRLKRIILRRRVFFPKTSLWRRIRSLSGYIFSLLLDTLAGY
jgi:hypothetical protein